MLVMADSGLYSYTNFKMVLDAGADALFRVGRNVELPVLMVSRRLLSLVHRGFEGEGQESRTGFVTDWRR